MDCRLTGKKYTLDELVLLVVEKTLTEILPYMKETWRETQRRMLRGVRQGKDVVPLYKIVDFPAIDQMQFETILGRNMEFFTDLAEEIEYALNINLDGLAFQVYDRVCRIGLSLRW